jgi:hypothetical protein
MLNKFLTGENVKVNGEVAGTFWEPWKCQKLISKKQATIRKVARVLYLLIDYFYYCNQPNTNKSTIF